MRWRQAAVPEEGRGVQKGAAKHATGISAARNPVPLQV